MALSASFTATESLSSPIVISEPYYLYRHIRTDVNEPFYIGIGKKQKPNSYFRAYSKNFRNKYWKNIVNATPYHVEIVYETDSEKEINEKEAEFILLYGRKDLKTGTLVNMTSGGNANFNVSPEVVEKLRKRMIGNTNCRGKKLSIETIKKMSESQSKRDYSYLKGLSKHTEETKNALRLRNKGNKYNLGKKSTQEKKDKISKSKWKAVQIFTKDGVFVGEYLSISQCAESFNVSGTLINHYLKNKKVHKIYNFKYKNNKHGIST